jgi:hypothetical protein
MEEKVSKSSDYPGYPEKWKVDIEEIPCDGDLADGCNTSPVLVPPKKN